MCVLAFIHFLEDGFKCHSQTLEENLRTKERLGVVGWGKRNWVKITRIKVKRENKSAVKTALVKVTNESQTLHRSLLCELKKTQWQLS